MKYFAITSKLHSLLVYTKEHAHNFFSRSLKEYTERKSVTEQFKTDNLME